MGSSAMRPTTLSPHILRTMLAVSLLLGQGTTGLAAQSSNRMYHLSRDIRLGGDGRWDYVSVDTAAHRLFIARQTRVMVVDQASGRLLAEIPGLDGAHGVALAYRAGHGFATSGRDSSVTMFDLRTLKVLRRTHAAVDADAILYDPASGRVFTFNGDAGTSTAIDPASARCSGRFPWRASLSSA
jgi:hypothetical protein